MGMFTLPVPFCSILGPVLFVWWGVVKVAGWLFSPPTPWHVRKITSPPSGVKKRRTRKKNGCGCVFAFQGLALGA